MNDYPQNKYSDLTVRVKGSTLTALILISQRTEELIPDMIERLIRDEATKLAIETEKELAEMLDAQVEQAEEDYFSEQLSKRLGFDVSDLQALMGWWKSYMGGME